MQRPIFKIFFDRSDGKDRDRRTRSYFQTAIRLLSCPDGVTGQRPGGRDRQVSPNYQFFRPDSKRPGERDRQISPSYQFFRPDSIKGLRLGGTDG